MPMTIDQANALDIRPPMTVQIEMAALTGEVPTISLAAGTYYLYDDLTDTASSLADLGDLSGIGFALDGTVTLYGDPLPAGTKVGLRGHVNTTVRMTITGFTGSALTVSGVSGPVSVNGTQVLASLDGTEVIPAESGDTITFDAPSSIERAVLAWILPGIMLNVTNANLETATLALRGDLDILNPTLPVSEIEFTVYSQADISTALASVPDGTPITYSAGYDGEMSDTRYFYLCEQITQTGNILRVHGQDASAALETEIWSNIWNNLPSQLLKGIYSWIKKTITGAGITLLNVEADPPANGSAVGLPRTWIGIPSQPKRNIIGFWMSRLRHDYPVGLFSNGITEFYLDFVDAGRPSLRWTKRTTSWSLDQEDCGDWQLTTERQLNKITQPLIRIREGVDVVQEDRTNDPVGSNITIFLNDYITSVISANPEFQVIDFGMDWITYKWASTPAGWIVGGRQLLQDEIQAVNTTNRLGTAGTVEYTPMVVSKDHIANNSSHVGNLQAQDANGVHRQIWPGAYTATQLFARSPKGGSFTFKGDPRWQPRDYVTITLTDATTKQVTVESLMLVHTGGGTYEQVTYREGWI